MTRDTPPKSERHLIGYVRASTSDQNNERQIDELLKFGVKRRDIFEEKASGKNMSRPGWKDCWRDIRKGDILVVHSINRLGRDLIEVVQTVRDLHEGGVDLKVLSMNLDTRTPTGRLIFAVVAAMAQWERELVVERTRNGLAAARARGKTGGAKANAHRRAGDRSDGTDTGGRKGRDSCRRIRGFSPSHLQEIKRHKEGNRK